MSKADDMAGISLWTWSDYERGGHPHYHGILSADRSPKLAAYTAMNLMRPPLVALGTENRAVIPAGEQFTAELSVFAREPDPGRAVTLAWQIRTAETVLREGKMEVVLEEQHVRSAGEAAWEVPADLPPSLHYLYLELREAGGTLSAAGHGRVSGQDRPLKEYVPYFQGHGVAPNWPEPIAVFDGMERQEKMDEEWKVMEELMEAQKDVLPAGWYEETVPSAQAPPAPCLTAWKWIGLTESANPVSDFFIGTPLNLRLDMSHAAMRNLKGPLICSFYTKP